MILRCAGVDCISPYQDSQYGYGHRVANPQKKLHEFARCTVCKSSIRIDGVFQIAAIVLNEADKKKKKKKK